MNKKEFLAGSLAALLLLTGSASNKNNVENEKEVRNSTQVEDSIALEEDITREVTEYGEYRISVIPPIETLDSLGILHYEIPAEYNVMSKDYDKAYKVEKLTVKTETASVRFLEDGTKIYSAPNGGTLSEGQAVRIIPTPVSIEESIIVLSEYLNEAKLTKRL